LVVAGPTGAGKSELALHLAKSFSGEIVGCDSVQVYRGLDIGSAKTPVTERRGIPHHLIDVAGPGEELTAGRYAELARAAISSIQTRRRLPIVVGGTGFYLRALLEGLSPAPSRDEVLRTRLSEAALRRPAVLHRLLRRFDLPAAERIHPNDHQKLIRAIEISALSRRPVSEIQSRPRNALLSMAVLKFGLSPPRQSLYERLNLRSQWMFENGLIEETRAAIQAGYVESSKALQSLGYKQALQALSGSMTLPDAIRECQLRTRQYAKRQMTWFRREAGIEWLNGLGGEPAILDEALSRATRFLAAVSA